MWSNWAHVVQLWAKSEMVPMAMEALVELGWNDPWNFAAHVQPVNTDFSLRYFACIDFHRKRTNLTRFPYSFPNVPNKDHPRVHAYLFKCCNGYCSSVGMSKGYMVRRSFGTAGLESGWTYFKATLVSFHCSVATIQVQLISCMVAKYSSVLGAWTQK